MTKIVKKVNWISEASNAQVEVKITVSKEVKEVVSFSDGWNIPMGTEIVNFKEITISANGKFVESSHANPEIVDRANGVYARIYSRAGIHEEQYNLIMAAITEAEAELEAQFAAENEEVATAEKERLIAEEVKATEIRVERAERMVKEAAAREIILTDKEEEVWRENYNNIMNEGGEGYVPQRVTKESLAWANRILGNE